MRNACPPTQAHSIEIREDVDSLQELREVLEAKQNRVGVVVREGAVKVVSNGFFLKGFLKKTLNFKWQQDDSTWEKEITDENSAESIMQDLEDLTQEWGFLIQVARVEF